MSNEIMKNVDTCSTKFREGVEAGLNSTEDTRNWKAGNALGRELKGESANKEAVTQKLLMDDSIPLFMKDSESGNKGNAQDEKDEAEE